MLRGGAAEEPVLFHQRRNVLARTPDRKHELRVGEQLQQILHPREVVIPFRRVALAAGDQQQLADVIAIEHFEGLIR